MKFPKKVDTSNKKRCEFTSNISISKNLNENITRIKNDFGSSDDLIINSFNFYDSFHLSCTNIYIKTLVDKTSVNNLSSELAKLKGEYISKESSLDFDVLINYFSGLWDSKEGSSYDFLYESLLLGNTVFLIDGSDKYFTVATNSHEGRNIDEPTSQTVIRGPKESFTERLITNILLIRRRIKNKDLRVEYLAIGSITKTTISLMYIDKIAKKEIIEKIRERLNKIKIDGILDSGYISQLIKDDRYSIFPTLLNSEKPDSVVACLLEGRIAIIVDGSPYVLTAPSVMAEFLQSSEDYYHHYFVASLTRLIRYICFFMALLIPAVYIALITYHQEIIPTPLLISIAAQREGVPFPTFFEALIMMLTFEVLSEAGIRMPRAIGSAISIVGALVLGQAAVEASIISAVMVIIVSLTAIATFVIPNYEMLTAVRVLRLALMFLAGILGLYGVFMGLLIMMLHLCKLKSMTIPYLTPIAPRVSSINEDTIFRFPLWKMKYRHAGISNMGTTRVSEKKVTDQSEKNEPELG